MAQRYHTVSINDSGFPLLTSQQPRSVIGDSSNAAKEYKPSLYYCHNVMPTSRGLDSVGYKIAVGSALGLKLQGVRELYSQTRARRYVAWNDKRELYYLTDNLVWGKAAPTIPDTTDLTYDSSTITLATVNGVSYIFYSGVGAFTFDSVNDIQVPVTLTGLAGVIANYLGVVGVSGYLVAYTDSAIVWSSTIDPTDFTPSAVTGAGGGQVAGIGGAIKFCLANTLGLLIYAETNIIAGTYTGNTKYPFKFREVDNSKGGLALDLVAYDANSAEQFVYNKAGLQSVTSQKSATILPEVTDFLAGKVFEDYIEATGELSVTDLTERLRKKVRYVSGRYLIISYGITSFTHALVYDLALNRLGKLKLTHTDCFDYVATIPDASKESAKESIGFLLPDGSIRTLDFSVSSANSGVALLGKFQYVRSSKITLLRIEIETVRSEYALAVSNLASLDGKTTTETPCNLESSVDGLRSYILRTTAKNHTVKLVGAFNLTSLLLTYVVAGRR